MCITHQVFGGKRLFLLALNLSGNLISLKHAIHYKIMHLPLCRIKKSYADLNLETERNQN